MSNPSDTPTRPLPRTRPPIPITIALAMTALMVVGLMALVPSLPVGAEIDDTVKNFWGVSGVAPALTNNAKSEVWAIEQVGNTMYVGGKFTDVRGGGQNHDQPFLAAFHADTGRWIDWWRPELDSPVYALHASEDGSKLFVGGEFATVNESHEPGFAVLDPATGELVEGWTTRVSGGDPVVVRAFEIGADGWLYLGGGFTQIAKNGIVQPAARTARIDPDSGDIDSGWKPFVSGGGVWDIDDAPDGSRVYLAGFFTSVNLQGGTQGFAAVSGTDGAALPDLEPFGVQSNLVDYSPRKQYAVAAVNDLVFVGGEEHLVQVLDASDLSRRQLHFSGSPESVDPWPLRGGGDFQAFEVSGDRVYASCHCWSNVLESDQGGTLFGTLGPMSGDWQPVRTIMAFSSVTGERENEFFVNASGTGGVWAIKSHSTDGCLWFGGNVRTVGGKGARHVARVCDSAGPGESAGPALRPPPADGLSAPKNCTAVVSGDDVELNWAGSNTAADYLVYRNGFWAGRTTTNSLTDVAVPSTRTHSYSVLARDNANNKSSLSACSPSVIDLNSTLGPVPSCTVTVDADGPGTARIDWEQAPGGDRYVVYRNPGTADHWTGAVNAPGSTFTDGSVREGITFTYKVETRTDSGIKTARTVCTPA